MQDCGYNIQSKLLNTENFALPQLRERIYFVGFRKDLKIKVDFFEVSPPSLPPSSPPPPPPPNYNSKLKDFLNPSNKNKFDKTNPTFIKYLNNKYNKNRVNLDEILKHDFLIIDTRQSDLRIYENKSPTLRRDRQGLLYTFKGEIYKLSALEALKLQGFGELENLDNKIKNLKSSDILRQSGNAMSVSVVKALAKRLLEVLNE